MPVTIDPSFWKNRPVFITGATGLLGGWTVRRLLEAGADVVALVRDSVPRSILAQDDLASRVTMVHGELENASLMKRIVNEYDIDTVLHLAAQPIVGVAKLDPVGTFRANIEGTWNILEAARLKKVRQVVVASSDKAYGDSENLPYLEDHPLQGRYPYDASKSCADLLSQTYLQTYGLPVSIVRCANLFGGGDLNYNRVIPGVIRATLEGERFVIRSDGKFIRDYLYIRDAADAYLHLVESLAAGAPQGAFNFSLEVQLSVLDCVNEVLTQMGRTDLEPVIMNQASAEIRAQYMDCTKARTSLGWSPAYSFREGIAETIAWYRRHLDSPAGTETLAEVV